MNKAIGLALLVVGVILICAGYNASQSFSSDVSRFFTGSATNKAMWMLVGGVAAAIAGAVLLNRRKL
jgi:drug/metabolite transporter (DMT)-like permease